MSTISTTNQRMSSPQPFSHALRQATMIEIFPEDRLEARQLSDRAHGEPQQWSVYLQFLCWKAFERWLHSHIEVDEDLELTISTKHCSLFHAAQANICDAVHNIEINEFKVCLIVLDHPSEEEIIIPQSAIDSSDFSAHFYVVLGMWDPAIIENDDDYHVDDYGECDEDCVILYGIVRRDQLEKSRIEQKLQISDEGNYLLPWTVIQPNPYYLFHYIEYLSPEAIALPTAPSNTDDILANIDLNTLAESLTQPDQSLSEILSEQQCNALLTHPELLQEIYDLQSQTLTKPTSIQSAKIRLQESIVLLTQPAINTALWLQNKLDDIAENLEFYNPLNPSPELVFRQSIFKPLMDELRYEGFNIPDDIDPMCCDVEVDGCFFTLGHVMTRSIEQNSSSDEWEVVIFITTNPIGQPLPLGLKLQISTLSNTLAMESPEDSDEVWCWASAKVSKYEKWAITLLISDSSITLPPYQLSNNK